MPLLRRSLVTSALPAIVLTLLLTSACGSNSDSPKPEPEPASDGTPAQTEDSAPASGDVESFFAAISAREPAGIEQALDLAAPGSPAESYATYVLAVATAFTQGGETPPGAELSAIENGYRSCDDPADEATCVEWTAVAIEGGKIATFDLNGQDVSELLSRGDGTAVQVKDVGSVEFLVAYRSPTNNALFVATKVTAGPLGVIVDGFASYTPSGGESIDQIDVYGNLELGAGETTTLVHAFPDTQAGGTVTYDLINSDVGGSPVEVPVP